MIIIAFPLARTGVFLAPSPLLCPVEVGMSANDSVCHRPVSRSKRTVLLRRTHVLYCYCAHVWRFSRRYSAGAIRVYTPADPRACVIACHIREDLGDECCCCSFRAALSGIVARLAAAHNPWCVSHTASATPCVRVEMPPYDPMAALGVVFHPVYPCSCSACDCPAGMATRIAGTLSLRGEEGGPLSPTVL